MQEKYELHWKSLKKHKFYTKDKNRDSAETREKNIMKQLINWENNNVMAHVMLEKEANTHLSVRGWVLLILNNMHCQFDVRFSIILITILFTIHATPTNIILLF